MEDIDRQHGGATAKAELCARAGRTRSARLRRGGSRTGERGARKGARAGTGCVDLRKRGGRGRT